MSALDDFVSDAKTVDLLQAFSAAGGSISALRHGGGEYVGPCPACGGKDRFALNERKQVFNCRGAEGGGPLDLIKHIVGCDFLTACETALGRDRPGLDDAGRERRAEDRRAAERERERRRQVSEEEARARQDTEDRYRQRELDRCLAIVAEAAPWDAPGTEARLYLEARGLDVEAVDGHYLRTHPRLGFFVDMEKGPKKAIHHGPAMIGLFAVPGAGRWRTIGIHQTWIDLANAPKFRPDLRHPETGEAVPSKKMRGSKAGGLIPIAGRISKSRRMVAGEGIETTLGFARFDGFRLDTFYCAAGDLGNLAGKAERDSRIRHPTIRREVGGRSRAWQVPGVVPDMASACLPVPDHIEELVLLGDGDSEVVMTRAALKRGCARHAREGRTVRTLFAPAGGDWADVPVTEDA